MIIGITGGTGGLGKRLIEMLIKEGYKIKLFVRKTSDLSYFSNMPIEYVYGDLQDKESLNAFTSNIQICFHLAAQVSADSKKELFSVNVKGCQNLCESIIKNSPNCRLIYCSSIVVKNLSFFNRAFASNYTMSKHYAELEILKYFNKIKTTIIYPGYIYGYHDRNFMPSILKMLEYGVPFFVKGGELDAPVVFVDDLCELMIKSAFNNIAIGKKYISLEKNEIGIHEFIRMIAREEGYKYPTKIYPKMPLILIAQLQALKYKIFKVKKPKLTIRVINALSGRAKYFNNAIKDLGWHHKTNYLDGIRKTLEYYESEALSGNEYT